MIAGGWVVDCDINSSDHTSFQAARCETAVSWAGFTNGEAVGTVSARLSGTGVATLVFGNCVEVISLTAAATVTVYLDGVAISTAVRDVLTREVAFAFTDGALLEIKEANVGVIKLHSFTIEACTACEVGKHKASAGNVGCTPCSANASNCMATSRGTCDAGYEGSTSTGTSTTLSDVSTRAAMIAGGWVVDCDINSGTV
jgi:hypothetical protein